jgi:hypothetical protein
MAITSMCILTAACLNYTIPDHMLKRKAHLLLDGSFLFSTSDHRILFGKFHYYQRSVSAPLAGMIMESLNPPYIGGESKACSWDICIITQEREKSLLEVSRSGSKQC